MKNMSLERITCMFSIHFIGMLEVHKSLADADFGTCKFRRLPRQFTIIIITTFSRCCCVGVQINSSALETVTKVCAWQVDKVTLWENLVTKHSTFSYLSCDYIIYYDQSMTSKSILILYILYVKKFCDE